MKKVKVGFIGCGVFATKYHLENAKRNPFFEIRALCDIDKDILADRKKRFGNSKTYATANYKKILADKELDFVFIITGHSFHAKLLPEAAEAGKNIFVEKPMANTVSECRRIVDAVQKNRVKLMVGYNRRFSPSIMEAKKVLMRVKGDNRAMYHYRMVDDIETWDHKERYMGRNPENSRIVGEGCHIFDLLPWFCDSEPVSIYADGTLEGDVIVSIRFSNGDIASIFTSGIGSQYYPKENFEIFCNRTTIISSLSELVVSGPKEFKRELYPMYKDTYKVKSSREKGNTEYLFMLQGYKKDHVAGRVNPDAQPEPDKGHYNELTAFAEAILNNKPSPVDEFSGTRATVMALKAMESIKTGKPQEIKLTDYYFDYRKR